MRSFSPETAAQKIYRELLTPDFLHYLEACPDEQQKVDAITCWLRREPENDWFVKYQYRLLLYGEYIRILEQINEGPICEVWEAFHSVYSAAYTEWIDIMQGGTPVGFLVIGYGDNCHPDADYYIEEAFVSSEYQRQGLMTKTIEEYITAHNGTYCYFTLRKNQYAKEFWEKIFRKLGYTPVTLWEMYDDDLTNQFGWRR